MMILFCLVITSLFSTSYSIQWNYVGPTNAWALGCDWTGQDFSSFASTSSACGPLCLSTTGCTHFTWAPVGMCILKKNVVSISSAITVSNQTQVCGIVPSTSLISSSSILPGGVLQSTNNLYNATLLSNGDFAVYCYPGGTAIFKSGTNGLASSRVTIQSDCNLVISDSGNKTLWSTGTSGKGSGACYASMLNNGNFVISDSKNITVWSTNTGTLCNTCQTLQNGWLLTPGQSMNSSNNLYQAVFQTNGDFVIYCYPGGTAIYKSGTNGQTSQTLVMQRDCNFVMYDKDSKAVWSSKTSGKGTGCYATMQNNGNFVIYDSKNTTIWSTDTGSQCSSCQSLKSGWLLTPGQVMKSSNSLYQATLQANGDFVVYAYPGGTALYKSVTNEKTSQNVVMQKDCNFVMYDKFDVAVWSSGTSGKGVGKCNATMRQDGNFVVYDTLGAVVWSTMTGAKCQNCSTIKSGMLLTPGQQMLSSNSRYTATLQTDGDFVIRAHPGDTIIYRTGTSGKSTQNLILQYDCNLVMYDNQDNSVWSSRTYGKGYGTCFAKMRDDGNFVLYNSTGYPMWSTLTGSWCKNCAAIKSGMLLTPGQQMVSSNNLYKATLQTDGDFVIRAYPGDTIIYRTATIDKSSQNLILQYDCNLVMYDNHENAVWSSGTHGKGNGTCYATMQDDGNFVIYDSSGTVFWTSFSGSWCKDCTAIKAGMLLIPGQKLVSSNQVYKAILQTNGDFVLYAPGEVKLFKTGTAGKSSQNLIMQYDCNLVMYNRNGDAVWSSGTSTINSGFFLNAINQCYLGLQDNGNLIVYDGDGYIKWSSNTGSLCSAGGCSTLQAGMLLNVGEKLYSPNGAYIVVLQGDGNLVVYKSSNALWSSHTVGKSSRYLVMQLDCNLVLYDNNGDAVWSSKTYGEGEGPCHVSMQRDGNFVVYDSEGLDLWGTGIGSSGFDPLQIIQKIGTFLGIDPIVTYVTNKINTKIQDDPLSLINFFADLVNPLPTDILSYAQGIQQLGEDMAYFYLSKSTEDLEAILIDLHSVFTDGIGLA